MDLTYKEYVIPKKGGKVRKIVAPSPDLKKHQRGHLSALEHNFKQEEHIHLLSDADIFHGFIKGKNCVTAATKHIGYEVTLMMDIKHFFDSVQYNYLPRRYKLPQTLFHAEGYAAQGFPSSPMIANIAIVPVIATLYTALKTITKGDFALTVYADDIQVSVNDPKYLKAITRLVEAAFYKHGYIINKDKTRAKFAKHGYRRILGVNVGETSVRATRKTMRKLRAAKHQASKVGRVGDKVKAARSAGGLTTWSKCILPNKARS